MATEEQLDAAYAHAASLVAEQDKDRFLASLFIPEAQRRHILALQAFNVELARVRDVVSEPLPGEVRMQWWRDVITVTARGDVEAHPVALALLDTMQRYTLPPTTLLDMIDARTFDLYDDVMPTLNDLEGYAGETASALFQLSAIIAADGGDPGTADASGYAGVAYALTGLLRSVGFHARRNQIYLPKDILDKNGVSEIEIRAGKASPQFGQALAELRMHTKHHYDRVMLAWSQIDTKVRPIFLPLALIPPTLKRLEGAGAKALHQPIEVPQWLRQWHLWRASKRWM